LKCLDENLTCLSEYENDKFVEAIYDALFGVECFVIFYPPDFPADREVAFRRTTEPIKIKSQSKHLLRRVM